MTVENSIRRYKAYVANGNTRAAEDMKNHMLSTKSKKYKDHPFLKELTPSKQTKDNGKKPKR